MNKRVKRFFVLVCFLGLVGICFTLMSGLNGTGTIGRHVMEKAHENPSPMTLMVRTSSKRFLMKQFYCQFLRTAVLFWPPSYGDVVMVLDEESAKDKIYGDAVLKQFHRYFPEYTFRVFYEPLPKDPGIFKDQDYRGLGYERQLWSTFFSDLYSNESIIAYMDTDVLMLTSITRQNLVNGAKLKVFGFFWNRVSFATQAIQIALGFPLVVDFMTGAFPQLIYRDTYINCRQHIMKHLKTTDFEKAFSRFHPKRLALFPISVIMSYAWYFEKDRYEWHLKIPNLKRANRRLPEGHKVQPEDTLPDLVPTIHTKQWSVDRIKPGYCMSMTAQGQVSPECKNVTHDLLKTCDLGRGDPWRPHETWCKGMGREECCQQAINEHYDNVRYMARTGLHSVQRDKAESVSIIAEAMGIQCEPLNMP